MSATRIVTTTPEPPTRFRTIYERCVHAAEASGAEPFSLWPLTDEVYRTWKANAGNAKARRRWRRRNIPNSQRPAERFHAQVVTT